ncbi:hypothetical protein [Legionella gresilensis]|uniref:hypothetical protein n=1 Tax=Legionella gresilensis TaxID=91823 RepID=UPI001041215B|nr:hypothetical protein [Legionella gresilensis]
MPINRIIFKNAENTWEEKEHDFNTSNSTASLNPILKKDSDKDEIPIALMVSSIIVFTAIGTALGSLIFPGVGTFLGAGLGGVFGALLPAFLNQYKKFIDNAI